MGLGKYQYFSKYTKFYTFLYTSADSVQITLGAHKPMETEDTQVVVTSQNVVVHEKFNQQTISDDIALVILLSDVVLNNNIQTVALPASNDNKYVGATAKISGWGLTDGFGNELAEVLNVLETTIISNEECKAVFSILRDSGICTTGDQQTGACNGDSGGPLTVNEVQVGIVSFGISRCLPGYPSAFTRTSSYLDWIEQNSS